MKNHPAYQELANGGYGRPALAAKLARTALRQRFPGVKFFVRSDSNSVNISWMDGPTTKAVDAVVAALAGYGFDGSVDYQYYNDTWVEPDGTFYRAASEGSADTGGYVEGFTEAARSPDAVSTCFHCYVFTSRELSDDARDTVIRDYAATHDDALADAINAGEIETFADAGRISTGMEWGDMALYRAAQDREFSLETA